MTLPLELGQVEDPETRRALEQISVNWPSAMTVPVVAALPATGALGQVAFLTTDNHLYVYSGGWNAI
jgi:hypothetical protein